MWKNFRANKVVKSVYVTYRVEGLNQDRLIESLKKHDIVLYNIKKTNNKLMYISVNLHQSKNFFAIAKELCYNIKKLRYSGKGFALYSLIKNAGLVLGAIAFIVLSVLSNDYIYRMNFYGSGSVYQREVREYLYSRGITEKARFSSFSLERLEDEILASNPRLTFVGVEKKGNTLSVYLVLKTDKTQTQASVTELKSTVNGVVEQVKVYRGRALVSVGDVVKEGDLLVDGQVEIKEQTLSLNVLAFVSVRVEEEFIYLSKKSGEEEIAVLYAHEKLDEKEPVNTSVSVESVDTDNGQRFKYTVKTQYICKLYAN